MEDPTGPSVIAVSLQLGTLHGVQTGMRAMGLTDTKNIRALGGIEPSWLSRVRCALIADIVGSVRGLGL